MRIIYNSELRWVSFLHIQNCSVSGFEIDSFQKQVMLFDLVNQIPEHFVKKYIQLHTNDPTLLTDLLVWTEASPWCGWTLLFKSLDVNKLYSLSSTSGLKNIALKK